MERFPGAPSAAFALTGKKVLLLQPEPVTRCWPTKASTSNCPQEGKKTKNKTLGKI